ncbi:MAG: DUF1801 domain-containing protein [Bacteroidetes bacterium]|nr:DUF1801 domain-containing protein [Bacteroidota bacterium]
MEAELHPGVVNYLHRLQPWQKEVFLRFRSLILQVHPHIQECFTYQVPFYKLNGLYCYFSVLKKGRKTVWGICDGFALDDPYHLLRADEKQTQIRHLVFEENAPFPDEEILMYYLISAAEIKLNKGQK